MILTQCEGMTRKQEGLGVLALTPTDPFLLLYLEAVDLHSIEETNSLQNSIGMSVHVIWNEGSCCFFVFVCELRTVDKLQEKPTVAVDFIILKSMLSKKEEDNQLCEMWKRII